MTTRRVRDLCGLYCVAEFADYQRAEFFMYLIGTGVSRSRYELTAHDRQTGALMFDMQVEAGAPALEARAGRPVPIRRSGSGRRLQARAADSRCRRLSARYTLQLQVEEATESLQRIGRLNWSPLAGNEACISN